MSEDESAVATGPAHRVPSRGWYALAAVLLLVGLVTFGVSLGVARGQAKTGPGCQQG